jgi:hypothetical protein
MVKNTISKGTSGISSPLNLLSIPAEMGIEKVMEKMNYSDEE